MKQGFKNILLSAAAAITVFVMAQTPAFAATDTTATADMAATDTAATQEAGSEEGGNGEVDVQGIIFGHINDSYEWHITDIGG